GRRARSIARASRSLRASASAHLSTSPGGSTPSSSRSWPDDPPLSNIVTMAWSSIHGSSLRPPSRLGNPVPPPKQPTLSMRRRTRTFYRPAGAPGTGSAGSAQFAPYNGSVSGQLTLPVHTRRAFDRVAADLQRVFGDRFVALVASGRRAS